MRACSSFVCILALVLFPTSFQSDFCCCCCCCCRCCCCCLYSIDCLLPLNVFSISMYFPLAFFLPFLSLSSLRFVFIFSSLFFFFYWLFHFLFSFISFSSLLISLIPRLYVPFPNIPSDFKVTTPLCIQRQHYS